MLNPRPGPDLHLTLCWSSSNCVPPHSVRCPRAKGCTHPNPGQPLVAKLSPWDPGTFSYPTVLNLLWGPVRPLPLVVLRGRIPLSKGSLVDGGGLRAEWDLKEAWLAGTVSPHLEKVCQVLHRTESRKKENEGWQGWGHVSVWNSKECLSLAPKF